MFNTVEVNSTYYRPPTPEVARGWLRKAAHNPDFLFTAKLWQGFTHERSYEPSDVVDFRAGVEPLLSAGRLGALLVQLPWSFKYETESREHLLRLFEAFAGVPLVLEVRHASWDRPEALELLRDRRVGFCNIDQPIFHGSLGATTHVTSEVGYVRLHGRNAKAWFDPAAGRDERYDYLYGTDELDPWVERIHEIERRARRVFVVTNNHFGGKAIVNALELQSRHGGPPIAIPQRWVASFPRLGALPGVEPRGQIDLFAS